MRGAKETEWDILVLTVSLSLQFSLEPRQQSSIFTLITEPVIPKKPLSTGPSILRI